MSRKPNPSVPAKQAGKSIYEETLDVLLTGVAIIVPLVITVYILNAALGFVTDALRPIVDLLKWLGMIEAFQRLNVIQFLIEMDVYALVIDFLGELFAVMILLGVIIVIGLVGRHRYGRLVIDYFDLAIASVPGVGTVYKSFRRMGDVMLDDGSENFNEVRLVECLGEDLYLIGFETGQSPETVGESTGHEEMVTMFLPLAPNPVTGGFLAYVPRDRVRDVDMTIEEGIRSILTSGVATDERTTGRPDSPLEHVGGLEDVVPGAKPVTDESGDERDGRDGTAADPDDEAQGTG